MFGSMGSALTGILGGSRMLEASAHNIANAQTPGFKRIQAIPVEQGEGGVRVILARDQNPGVSMVANGEIVEGSNVDLAQEIIQSLQTAHFMEANIAMVHTQDKLIGSLLDIVE